MKLPSNPEVQQSALKESFPFQNWKRSKSRCLANELILMPIGNQSLLSNSIPSGAKSGAATF